MSEIDAWNLANGGAAQASPNTGAQPAPDCSSTDYLKGLVAGVVSTHLVNGLANAATAYFKDKNSSDK